MRVRLLIDIDTEDLPRLQQYVGDQPAVRINIPAYRTETEWDVWGRFVGAKEALDGLDDAALKDTYDRQAEREKNK